MRIQISVDTTDLSDILKELNDRIDNDTVTTMKRTVEEAAKEGFKPFRDDLIERARALYADDDLAVDDDAALSDAETHVWVSAWVYVRLPEEDDDFS
jgi:hypothetical protein